MPCFKAKMIIRRHFQKIMLVRSSGLNSFAKMNFHSTSLNVCLKKIICTKISNCLIIMSTFSGDNLLFFYLEQQMTPVEQKLSVSYCHDILMICFSS